MIEAVQNRL